MRLFPAGCLSLACATAALFLAGCDTASDMADSVRTTLSPREAPQMQAFTADQRATYEAALKALDDIGFRYTHGGPAEGILEAVNRVETGETPGGARQISLKAHFDPAAGGGTMVTVAFNEIVEADSENQAGLATDTPLQDTSLYQVFLRAIQEHLAPAGAAAKG